VLLHHPYHHHEFVCCYSDQRVIDVENRSNYIALRKRWEVLDKTITFPEDEIGADNEPSYMDHSEDECDQDDSNSLAPPTTHQGVSSSYEPTIVCRTCGKPCTVAEDSGSVAGEGGVAAGGGVVGERCVGCTSSDAEGQERSVTEGHGMGGASVSESCYLCEPAQNEHRYSTTGVLDEDGLGMLNILELTSRVSCAISGAIINALPWSRLSGEHGIRVMVKFYLG